MDQIEDGGIQFVISSDSISAELGEEISLRCTITNLGRRPFRLRKAWGFSREGNVNGCIFAEILLDGKPYLDWQKWVITGRAPRWKKEHLATLQKGESLNFDANLTTSYPLERKGTYTLQATFKPEQLIGVKVSTCHPVKSNWVTIVVE